MNPIERKLANRNRIILSLLPQGNHCRADYDSSEKGNKSDGVRHQGTHVAVETEVIGEVETQSTTNVVELEYVGRETE